MYGKTRLGFIKLVRTNTRGKKCRDKWDDEEAWGGEEGILIRRTACNVHLLVAMCELAQHLKLNCQFNDTWIGWGSFFHSLQIGTM